MQTDKEKLLDLFYKNAKGELDLNLYGAYRLGLTEDEIKDYLCARAYLVKYKNKDIHKLYSKFNKIAGVNTVAVGPHGEHLMYRHDVLRFASVLFDKKETYWD